MSNLFHLTRESVVGNKCNPPDYLRELLGVDLDSSHQTEGSLVFESLHFIPVTNRWVAGTLDVMATGGQQQRASLAR